MKYALPVLAALMAMSASAQLRISEICPQPGMTVNGDIVDAPDPNGKKSGWVELVNTSDQAVDLANYELQRFNRGKEAVAGKFDRLPSQTVAAGARVVLWTSEDYENGADGTTPEAYPDETNGGTMVVVPFKVNPKKYPIVRLVDYSASESGEVVDTFIIPVDLAKGKSIAAGPASEQHTHTETTIVESVADVLSASQSWTSEEALAWKEPLADDEDIASVADGNYTIDEAVVERASASDANDVERVRALDFANAASATGEDDYIVTIATTNELENAESVSVSLWFFAPASAAPAAGGYVSLFAAQSENSVDSGSVSLWLDSSGALVADRGGNAVASASGGLFDGAWHHVALILGRSAGARYAVFLDGSALVDTEGTGTGTAATAPSAATAVFTGVEVRPQIFARELTDNEITQIAAWDGPDKIEGSQPLNTPEGAVSVTFTATGSDEALALALDGVAIAAGEPVEVNGAGEHTLSWLVSPEVQAAGSYSFAGTAHVETSVTSETVIPAGAATVRYIVDTPTQGADNGDLSGAIPYGPNIGPLYGVKHKLVDWNAFAQATNGQDYAVSFAVNPVSAMEGDQIVSVKLIYRADFGDEVTNAVAMAAGAYDKKGAGQTYADTISAAAVPAAGHLLRWAAVIEDAQGRTWRSPSFCDPDGSYQYYGTIVAPTADQVSANLQTFHLFADANSVAQMDIDADKQNKTLVPYNARVGIYDGSTGFYYDNVRIDLRGNTSGGWKKKSHGLRFNKSQPLTCTDPVTGQTVEEIRKTSFIAEYPDPAHIRQALSFQVFRDAGCLVPFDYPVRLQLNGAFYEMAFHSNRFTDELIEDYYGLDPEGYAYKNVGTFANYATTGTPEKKTPDDGHETDSTSQTVLKALCNDLAGSSVNETDDDSALDNAALSRKVVKHFDLPAWLNYLAVARITTETDDTWANISAYYDVNGTGTWMPLAYDLNSSWGQFYKDDGIGQIGPLADEDWFKAHPLYGGYRIMAHKSEGGDVIGGAIGSSTCRGNRAIDAIYQDARFRRMYLRRLRTLMDEVLKAPGTAKEDTPFWQWVQMVTDAEWEDARLDQMHWEQSSASGKTYANSEIWVWKNTPRFNWDADGNEITPNGLDDLWDNYIEPRRTHLFVTHSETNTAKTIGYAWDKNAGIPESQAPTETLRAGFAVVNTYVNEGGSTLFDAANQTALVITNDNDVAVDVSGWVLSGSVSYTMAPGTVIDAHGVLIVAADRKAYVEANLANLTDEMLVGNAAFDGSVSSLFFKDAAGVEVFKLVEPTDVSRNLRVLELMPKPAGDGDTGEYIVLTNCSAEVTLDLAGVRVSGTDFEFTVGEGTLAPGGTIRFDRADWWPEAKIKNGKPDVYIYDANGTLGQHCHVETKWEGFEAANQQGGSFLALGFGDEVTEPSQWTVLVPETGHIGAKSAEGFVILAEEDADYDASKPLTFGTPDPAVGTLAISASMIPPESGTTATLTLLYKTDLLVKEFSEIEVTVSDINVESGTATVTIPDELKNLPAAFFFGFTNGPGVE